MDQLVLCFDAPRCRFPGCLNTPKRTRRSGLCEPHYRQELQRSTGRICSDPSCDRFVEKYGLCSMHARRFVRNGRVVPGPLQKQRQNGLCVIDGCQRDAKKLGLCNTHYSRMRRYGDLDHGKRNVGKTCCVEGCDKPAHCLDMCDGCYHRDYHSKKPEKAAAKRARRKAKVRGAGVLLVTEHDWRKLCKRYGNRCAYCGDARPLTQDHVVPIARGGRHSIGNLLPACKSCNCSKGTKLLVEWRSKKRRRAAA